MVADIVRRTSLKKYKVGGVRVQGAAYVGLKERLKTFKRVCGAMNRSVAPYGRFTRNVNTVTVPPPY
jgi:hypothetical protein